MSIAVGLAWAEEARRQAAAEIELLRLTDEEREAIEVTVAYLELRGVRNTSVQDTLRGLLARTE